jgi:predicted PurR-regulated permease PerM
VDVQACEVREARQDGPAPPPAEWAPATRFYRQLMTTTLSLVLLAVLVFLLEKFATILQQLLTAVFLVYMILPVHRWLERHRVPSAAAYLVITLLLFGLTTAVVLAVQASVADLMTKLPTYRANCLAMVERLTARLPEHGEKLIDPLIHREGLTVDQTFAALRGAVETLAGFLGQAFVVLVYLVFLLAEQAGGPRRIEAALGPERGRFVLGVVRQVNDSIAEYLWVKTVMSLLTGVLTTAVLYAFGVDYPVLWGVVAFLLNYIPYLGSLLATVLPVLLGLVQTQSFTHALLLLLVLSVVQNGIGYGIEPFLTGSRLNLSPLMIILALAFWGALWGIVGMILAVPLVVTARIALANIPATRPLAALMTGGGAKA